MDMHTHTYTHTSSHAYTHIRKLFEYAERIDSGVFRQQSNHQSCNLILALIVFFLLVLTVFFFSGLFLVATHD